MKERERVHFFNEISWIYFIGGAAVFVLGLLVGFDVSLIALAVFAIMLGYAWRLVGELAEELESLRKQVNTLEFMVDKIIGISKEVEEVKKNIEDLAKVNRKD